MTRAIAATPLSKSLPVRRKAVKKLIGLIVLSMSVLGAGIVHAHGAKPQRGGVVTTANDIQYELVNKEGKVLIYVEDHGRAVATAGATGKLTVLNGAKKTEFALQPANGNALTTDDAVRLAPGAKALATITFADKKTVAVRFAIK